MKPPSEEACAAARARRVEIRQREAERERGYCTEFVGGGQCCLLPAVADVRDTGPTGTNGLRCEQHVKGWPASAVTRL